MRWLLSWALYWIGHLVSRPVMWWDWPLYPVYNRLMVWSVNIQGDGPGPWGPPAPGGDR